MWQTADFLRTNVFRVCMVLLCVVFTFAVDNAQAQEPEPAYLIYLPIICTSPPWPYNVRAADFVLQPADMPPGYELDEEESGPIEGGEWYCGQAAVDAYYVIYFNDALLFTGTPGVGNIAAVFRTPQEASEYVQCTRDYAAGHPDFRRFISIPRMGDETLAYEFVSEDGILPATAYSILIRKGNLITHIATAAISYVADFDVTRDFAQKAYARLTKVISGFNTDESEVSGEILTEASKETYVQFEAVIELLRSQVHGQWGGPHLRDSTADR